MATKTPSMLTILRNSLTEGLMDYYTNIALGLYTWTGLPKDIPIVYPEKYLFDYGMCVMCKPSAIAEPVILPVINESVELNVWGEPTSWKARALGPSANLFNDTLTDKNSVLIKNSFNTGPTGIPMGCKNYVKTLVDQIVNTELTMRLNINAQKMPMMFAGGAEEILKNKNTFFEFMECQPVQFKTEFADQEFKIFTSGAPVIMKQLTDVYTEYDARILTYLAVNNLPIEKQERLLSDEVNVNKEEKCLIRKARTAQRLLSCEQMYDVFELDVDCVVNTMSDDKQNMIESNDSTEEENTDE